MTALKDYLFCDNQQLREIAAEGFAKLVMCNKLDTVLLPDVSAVNFWSFHFIMTALLTVCISCANARSYRDCF